MATSIRSLLGGAAIAVVTAWTLGAQAAELRLLTWSGYAPDEVIAEFKKATGHDVKVKATASGVRAEISFEEPSQAIQLAELILRRNT